MTYVKTQVVEFCGYQSSWGEEDKSVTYEYLTVSKNTASESNSDGFSQGQGHPPTPRPTRPPHHKLPGLNTNTGLFVAPMAGTYRVSFQVLFFSFFTAVLNIVHVHLFHYMGLLSIRS